MTNFQHGLVFSLATSIVTSLTLIGKIVKEKGPNEDFPVIRSIICLVAIPLIVFPIVNFILNAYFSFREDRIKEFISYEFSQILVWRISSVWHSVISLGSYNIFKKPTFSFVNPVYEFYKKYPEVGKLPDIGKIGSTHM
ncbi:hypothetical protein, partial [Leptospira sp. id769339]|uniref:hypothetical protein n=1 Tax=Leptospira sp. id769339 TaxID=2864221 RepID=UPI00214D082E